MEPHPLKDLELLEPHPLSDPLCIGEALVMAHPLELVILPQGLAMAHLLGLDMPHPLHQGLQLAMARPLHQGLAMPRPLQVHLLPGKLHHVVSTWDHAQKRHLQLKATPLSLNREIVQFQFLGTILFKLLYIFFLSEVQDYNYSKFRIIVAIHRALGAC